METAFTTGLLMGCIVAVPLLTAKRAMAAMVTQTGAAVAAGVALARFDEVRLAVDRWATILQSYPIILAGFASGLILVALIRAGLQTFDKD